MNKVQITNKFLVRKANSSDVEKICSLHLNAFSKQHFSVHLPIPVLTNYIFQLIKHNDYCYVVLSNNDRVIGYSIAGANVDVALNIVFSKHKFQIFLTILKNPSFLLEKIADFINLYFRQNKELNTRILVFIIAVDKNRRREGIGEALLKQLEKDLRINNESSYKIFVRKDNPNIKFHLKLYYQKFTEDKKVIGFIKEL